MRRCLAYIECSNLSAKGHEKCTTPWCRILFEKLIVAQLVKQYPAFLWNLKVHHCVHKSTSLDPILSQPNPVRPIDPYLPPTPWSSQWSPAFGPPNQNPVSTSPLLHACHMSKPPHPPWFNHPNNIRRRIQVMKLIIMQFSPWSVFPKRFPHQNSYASFVFLILVAYRAVCFSPPRPDSCAAHPCSLCNGYRL
jgi:hypothetical protein